MTVPRPPFNPKPSEGGETKRAAWQCLFLGGPILLGLAYLHYRWGRGVTPTDGIIIGMVLLVSLLHIVGSKKSAQRPIRIVFIVILVPLLAVVLYYLVAVGWVFQKVLHQMAHDLLGVP